MSSSPVSIPAGILSLREVDQHNKLRKRQQIEKYWECSIEEAIPVAIRPRLTNGRAKAKIGSSTPLSEWWRWSMDLINKLSDLAALTAGRLPFAMALMEAQVKQRQKDYTSHTREVAEVLVSDVINLIAALKERKDEDDEEGESSDDDDGDEDESGAIKKFDQDELQHLQGDEGQMDEANPPRNANRIGHLEIMHEGDRAGTTHDPVENETNIDRVVKREASPAGTPPSKRRHAPSFMTPQSRASTENRETRENIASLRASAARLHHQAAQKEAKAYRLEAEMFAREAGEG